MPRLEFLRRRRNNDSEKDGSKRDRREPGLTPAQIADLYARKLVSDGINSGNPHSFLTQQVRTLEENGGHEQLLDWSEKNKVPVGSIYLILTLAKKELSNFLQKDAAARSEWLRRNGINPQTYQMPSPVVINQADPYSETSARRRKVKNEFAPPPKSRR